MRILFVCHGNICRSPMAEFIFKDMLRKRGLLHRYTVASAATSDEEIWNGVGNPIYPPAQRELTRRGIPFEDRHATRLVREDYAAYDLLVAMDERNLRNMHHMLGGDPEGKIFKLLSFAGEEGDVADPWYSDRFDLAFSDIYRGCEALLEEIESNEK